MNVPIPAKLREELCAWEPGASAWVDSIPSIVTSLVDEWDLRDVGTPFEATLAWVAPVGGDRVLKVAWPHDESRDEALALSTWAGDGAVRLLRHDVARSAMLLERCVPGAKLGDQWSVDTIPTGADVLRRLWVASDAPFQRLDDLVAPWASITRQRAARWPGLLDGAIVELGCSVLEAVSSRSPHVLHGDFHPGNVLSSTRAPWLAIDPKPVVGDREWDAVMLLVHGVLDAGALRERLALVSDLLALDRDRLCRLALARVVEWVFWDAEVARDEASTVLHARQAGLLAGEL